MVQISFFWHQPARVRCIWGIGIAFDVIRSCWNWHLVLLKFDIKLLHNLGIIKSFFFFCPFCDQSILVAEKITQKVEGQLSKSQKEFLLRQQV